ncbi:hypothetical protein [Sphaerisporangium fuscum]|uniref:hypothetical protein n=1 Tax=Sphaerisporangium fuscum TaxID=2835868 RepID=UPI001BDC1EF0|nr:hypothetical protein [Sphaerisporangium fuscum]
MGHGEERDTQDTAIFPDIIESDLVDLSDLPLDVVTEMPVSVLDFALRRIHLEAIEGPVLFSNDYIESPPAPS